MMASRRPRPYPGAGGLVSRARTGSITEGEVKWIA